MIARRRRRVHAAAVVARCGCGARYSSEEWAGLRVCGTWDDGEGMHFESRHCPCGSTLSTELRAPRDTASSLTRAASALLLREFAPKGVADLACANSERGPRLAWETLEAGGILRQREAGIVPSGIKFYDLTPYGRAVLAELVNASLEASVARLEHEAEKLGGR